MLLAFACASTPHYNVEPANTTTPVPSAEASEASSAPVAASASAQGQDPLSQDAERIQLEREKAAVLVDRHITTARQLMQELRYDDAEFELLQALQLQPDNTEAKNLLNEVTALMGRAPGRQGTTVEDLAARYAVRVQQMQLQARKSLEQAKLYLSRGDYDQAIAELSIARNQIRWAPYSIDWQGMDKEVETLLQKATSDRLAAQQAERDKERQTAVEALRAQEQMEKARREAVINNMLEQAIDSFAKGDFDDAIDFCDQALHEDPRNERAMEIRDAASAPAAKPCGATTSSPRPSSSSAGARSSTSCASPSPGSTRCRIRTSGPTSPPSAPSAAASTCRSARAPPTASCAPSWPRRASRASRWRTKRA
jgi:tetratricopeptide (TPR) repeat protein